LFFQPIIFVNILAVTLSPKLKMPAAVLSQYQLPTRSMPLTMPGKSPVSPPLMKPSAPYSRIATSPPSAGSSVNSSAVPSLTSGSYAESGDHDTSSMGTHGVDLMEMMSTRLNTAVNPLPLDKNLARQAQM
jgi:hypothetical protein